MRPCRTTDRLDGGYSPTMKSVLQSSFADVAVGRHEEVQDSHSLFAIPYYSRRQTDLTLLCGMK